MRMQLKAIMKKIFFIVSVSLITWTFGQTSTPYKKKVLESTEIQTLFSYYVQEGIHGAVGGGLGTEALTNSTPTLVVTVPLNEDLVLSVESGISTYTSASSSNINPFMGFPVSSDQASNYGVISSKSPTTLIPSGASNAVVSNSNVETVTLGTPWFASSGASRKDALKYVSASLTDYSDDRNTLWNANAYASIEYDYRSYGLGGAWTGLFNEKNTELSLKAKVYLDRWYPIYPTELHEYKKYGTNFLTSGYFQGVPLINQGGAVSDSYLPNKFLAWTNNDRSSATLSASFSQILSSRVQFSIDTDLVIQQGLLSTPYHRIYFKDTPNYYIGNASFIPNYTSPSNYGVFRLADDIERMPDSRLKIPIGTRLNMYLNDRLTLRTFYRYYYDNWGIQAHTASVELPIKLSMKWTIYPNYRYYQQTQATYFKPFGEHLSTEQFYTSDYDLSAFDSQQLGFGVSYKDIFTNVRALGFGLKNIDFRFQHYYRSDGLESIIYGLGVKFVQ